MPTCARCHDWTSPSAGLVKCPVCDGFLVHPSTPPSPEDDQARRNRTERVKERHRAAYEEATANEWMDGVVFVVLVGATILTASVAAAVAGVLAWSIVAFALSLVGGIVLGVAWYEVPGRFRVARWPGALQGVAYYGGPIAAVLVAVLVTTGNAYAIAGVVAMTLVAVIWIGWSLWPWTAHRPDDPAAPLSRAKRLARLKTLRAEGRLTTEEYEAITADLRAKGGSRSP